MIYFYKIFNKNFTSTKIYKSSLTLTKETKIKMLNETVKGFRDYTGEEAERRERIREIIVRTFKLYGFEPVETPVIEREEFVRGNNQQDGAVSDVFQLQDKGKRELALRYEFTFQLKRLAKNKKLPYKRYQIGEVFRDEPVSSNRFRQFTQCDADVVGSSMRDEAEVLALTKNFFDDLGINSIIYINNRKLVNEILEEQKIKESDRQQVMRELDKIGKIKDSEILKNLRKYGAEKVVGILKRPESYFEKYSFYKDIKELKKYCKEYGLEVEFLPTFVRGLSYYNGSVFEVRTSDMKESVAGGGSYLVDGIQATGISFGLERVESLAKIDVVKKEIVVISINQDKNSIKLAEKLRENNVSVNLITDKSISKALEYTNSYKIPYVVFVGEEEVKKGKFKLRDMKSGNEEMLNEKELAGRLSRFILKSN